MTPQWVSNAVASDSATAPADLPALLGRLEPAEVERIIRLVASHVRVEVHAGNPVVSAELPPRDDGIHLVAQKRGTHVGVRGSMMRLSDDNGATIQNVPLANVESLSLLGSVQISTQAMQTLADRGIPVALLSAAGRMIALIDPLDSVSADTRRNQVRQFDQPEPCLTLARALISAKIRNQRTLLLRNHDFLPARVSDALADEAKAQVGAALPEAVARIAGPCAVAAADAGTERAA